MTIISTFATNAFLVSIVSVIDQHLHTLTQEKRLLAD